MKGPFFLCYFETTRRCNLHCTCCMTRRPVAGDGNELSTEEAKRLVLDELAAVTDNAAVAFSGGEHLLRPDAYELLAYAAGKNLWSFVNTNGRLLVETDAVRRAAGATKGRIIFVLPLNSVDAGTNRTSRDDDPATVLQAAEHCKKANVSYFFILTISKGNLSTLPDTMRYLKKSGVPMLRSPFVLRGDGAACRDLLLNAGDMEQLVHPALTGNHLSYVSFTPFFASPEIMQGASRLLGVSIAGLGCQAGRSFAAVSAEGDVTPCVQLLDSSCVCGNVRDEPLSAIIRDAPLFRALRERAALKGKCGRCRYRDTCGGCRAQAFYQTGDVMGEDPTCFFEPAGPSTRCPLERTQTAQAGRFFLYIKGNAPWRNFL
jgi:radical SAM protein with 4Fe4S-binding SPASM domain